MIRDLFGGGGWAFGASGKGMDLGNQVKKKHLGNVG